MLKSQRSTFCLLDRENKICIIEFPKHISIREDMLLTNRLEIQISPPKCSVDLKKWKDLYRLGIWSLT